VVLGPNASEFKCFLLGLGRNVESLLFVTVVGQAAKEGMRHLQDQGGLSCQLSNID
jgi:hypothetical protein